MVHEQDEPFAFRLLWLRSGFFNSLGELQQLFARLVDRSDEGSP